MAWSRLIIGAITFCSVVACSAQKPVDQKDAVSANPERGDEAALTFSPDPLGAGDLANIIMNGELGCAFALEKKSPVLLIARGNVHSDEPAEGAIKIAGRVIPLKSREMEGFDGLSDGTTFEGPTVTVKVERLSAVPLGDGESPPYPAKMMLSGESGVENAMEGLWTCGP